VESVAFLQYPGTERVLRIAEEICERYYGPLVATIPSSVVSVTPGVGGPTRS
jgi:hypothetical protein